MNRILSIPNDTIDKFKCSLCKNYLSQFPVYVIEDDKNVCGRCTLPEGTVRFRCKIFEEFAQHINFPCKYKEQGCIEGLLPKDGPSHEEDCHFKLVKCPGIEFTSCCWQGARSSMLSHCRQAHKDLFLKDGTFELTLNVSTYSRKFLEHDGSLFRFTLKHKSDSKILFFGLFHVREAIDLENYSYQVVLSKDKSNVAVESVTTTFSERKWCEIALDSLMVKNNERIVGKIAFRRTVADVATPKGGLNEDLLSLLKCSKCESYTLPPIHQFEDKIKCEYCLTDGTGSRNFSLDRIAEMLNYPCRFERNGCDLVLKCEKMKEHLMNCPLEDAFCPFCDEWSGLMKNIKSHLLERHGDMLVENDEEISIENYADTSLTRIIHYSDHIFKIKCLISRRDYKWWVNIVGLKKENFRYEVKIHNVKGNSRIIMQRKCVKERMIIQCRSEDDKEDEEEQGDNENEEGENDNEDDEEDTFCKVDFDDDLLKWENLEEIEFRVRIFKQ